MNLNNDSDYFLELQTQTGWGQMLASFSRWCAPEPGQQVLDIGTGPGLLPALFAQQGALSCGIDLDYRMFADPQHPALAAADAAELPFEADRFDLVTASNVLYLAGDPSQLLAEMRRVSSDLVCVLGPSERMTVAAAKNLAYERNLTGLARDTLINYAQRSEAHFRWSKAAITDLFSQVGLTLAATTLRMGDGLIRFARGKKI